MQYQAGKFQANYDINIYKNQNISSNEYFFLKTIVTVNYLAKKLVKQIFRFKLTSFKS